MLLFPEFLLQRPFLPLGTDDRLTLRPLRESDAEALRALANNKNVAARLARLPYPYTLADAYKFISFSQQGIKNGEHLLLAIERRADKKFMGVIGCESEQGYCELGYWLGEEFWEQGYGKEAVRDFIRFLFSVFQTEEIVGTVKETNRASRRIFEGLGFRETGTKESPSGVCDQLQPAVTYALTREEFRSHYKKQGLITIEAVTAAVINEEGKIFLAERPEGRIMPGVWEPPGGKIEPGETPKEAIVRELKEEIGIDVNQEDLDLFTTVSYPYEAYQLSMTCYLCRRWKGKPYGAEGQKVAWVAWEDLATLSLFPASVIPFHKLQELLAI
jgi:8-oxo-dGTP diphosphatase